MKDLEAAISRLQVAQLNGVEPLAKLTDVCLRGWSRADSGGPNPRGPYNIGCPPVTGTTAPEM